MPKPRSKDNSTTTSKAPVLSAFAKYFLLLLIIVVAANFGGGYWAYNRFVIAVEQQQLSELAKKYAQQQVAVVNKYMSELRNAIRLRIRSDNLTKAIVEYNAGTVEQFATELRNSITGSVLVRFYRVGSADVDPDSNPPIRFAELDMINRAEQRENVFPEASKTDNSWNIAIVEPLPVSDKSDDPVEAIAFIVVSANELLSALGNSNTTAGSTQLFQQFSNGQPQAIVQLGERGVGEGEEVAVPQSHWRVRFIPSTSLAQQAAVNPIVFFLLLGAVLVASIAVAYFIAKMLTARFAPLSAAQFSAQTLEPAGANASELSDPLFHGKSILDVDVRDEDTDLLGLNAAPATDPLDIRDAQESAVQSQSAQQIPPHIFRAYDIRGDAEYDLTPTTVVAIGRAAASTALEAGDNTLFVARDGRDHSPDIAEQLIEGIVSTGCNVINLGMVPTPLLYFAIATLNKSRSGVMVTASHNPANVNGFKIIIGGKPLYDDGIQQLLARISQANFAKGGGREENLDISAQYIERIFSDVALAGELSVVVDAGNGVAGRMAPRLFEELGCRVTPLFCDIDGSFPNHDPDPSVESNLQALIDQVKQNGADLGIALDGDGDRLGVVSASGNIIRPDRLLMLLAKDIVSRNPGADVIFDVKSSRELNTVITTYGGRPIMWKSGHSPMKAKMLETKALVGGEFSGHIFIAERWYGFDDGMYTAVRLMEIMSLRDQDLDSILAGLPNLPSTPEIKIPIDDNKKFNFIRQLIEQAEFPEGRLTTIDGLRVDFEHGWGLVRASNTSAALTLRFEADSEEVLHDIQQQFKYQILKVDSDLIVAF